jgi:hypothetical protein
MDIRNIQAEELLNKRLNEIRNSGVEVDAKNEPALI